MKQAGLAAVALCCACGRDKPLHLPVIVSFMVDNAAPMEGDAVTFSFEVQNATKVSLFPIPAAEAKSPVTVTPISTGPYVLRAENADGKIEQTIGIVLQKLPPVRVTRFTALPGQSKAAGQDVTLTWAAQQAVRLELSDGSGAPPQDVSLLSTLVVRPMTTTLYTLTAYAKAGRTPASHSATTAARVVKASQVTSFTATPGDIDQGQAVTLSWSGDALSWAIKADTDAEPITMGPRRTLVVQPAQTTTYTLLATGPAGTTSGGSVTVKVAPTAPTNLSATEPDTPAPLRLEASCTAETCKLSLIATASVSLRGVALNLPIDASKVSVGPVTLDPAAFPAPSTGAVKLGFGPLQNVLVLGAAIQGSGTAAAQDAQLASGAHLLDFDLTLQPSGGVGKVFDGAAAQSWLQGALGRTSNAIAVGKLSAQ